MASGKLTFDVEEIRALAKYMRREKEDRINAINKIKQQVSRVNQSWTGADSQQFVSNFNERIVQFTQLLSNYDSVAKTLDWTANLLEVTTQRMQKNKF